MSNNIFISKLPGRKKSINFPCDEFADPLSGKLSAISG